MSFLSIPSQEGLFIAIHSGKSAAEAECRSAVDDDEDDDDEEDDAENIRLIPRCSPVPRKRGQSLFDESAEYMKIHFALSSGKRVSFADTTGGDLVDVKEFVAFDSDEEGDSERWEEEEAKYRKPAREPTYHVRPEFVPPAGGALIEAVRANKVEVEQVSPVEDEPLAFTGLVRVLNVSFHKAVFIRSTMDNWATYFDHPTDYVQGSHDGETDQFSFKLSFAPPYSTHGSLIEFVVRYETSEGDFWANNSSLNYVVTLLLSYEDDAARANFNTQLVRSILKPPKYDSADDSLSSEDEQYEREEEAGRSVSGFLHPLAATQPELDLAIALHPSGPSVPPNLECPSVDAALSTNAVSPGQRLPSTSSESALPASLIDATCASDPVQPNKSQPSLRIPCEFDKQASDEPEDQSPSAMLASPPKESRLRSGGEEIPSSAALCTRPPAAETKLRPAGEDGLTDNQAAPSLHELSADSDSAPVVTRCDDGGEDLAESSSVAAPHGEGGTPAVLLPPLAESRASPGAEALPSLSAAATEENSDLHPVQSWNEKEAPVQISPDASLENPTNTPSEAAGTQSECNVDRNLRSSFIFLSGIVLFSVVLQEPRVLFLIGLFLALLCV